MAKKKEASNLSFEDIGQPELPDLSSKPDIQELIAYRRAEKPATWVCTYEEDRLIELVKRYLIGYRTSSDGPVSNKLDEDSNLYIYSVSRGLVKIDPNQPDKNLSNPEDNILAQLQESVGDPVLALVAWITQQGLQAERAEHPNVIILQDIDAQLNPMYIRKFRDMFSDLMSMGGTHLIFSSTSTDIPRGLEKYISIIDLAPPGEEEIKYIFRNMLYNIAFDMKADLDQKKMTYPEENITLKDCFDEAHISMDPYSLDEEREIVRAATGLTEVELLSTFNYSIGRTGRINPDIVKGEKKQIIQKDKCLEYYDPEFTIDDIGGLDNLKEYLIHRTRASSEEALAFNIKPPKGVLLLGISGCGKSLFAKVISKMWKVPLIRFDFGRMMQGLVGASELNLRNALKTIDSLGRCVLWIDEIEKNASGMGSSNVSDGGTFARMMGYFLWWLQERSHGAYCVATANSIMQGRDSALPPELTRAGRFDEIFFVDLPTENERKEIFGIHLRKIGRDPKSFNLDRLAKIRYEHKGTSYDYSGAEIEDAINSALILAFNEEGEHIVSGSGDITEEHIERALLRKIPLSKSRSEVVNGMRKWAENNAMFASKEAEERSTGPKVVKGSARALINAGRRR